MKALREANQYRAVRAKCLPLFDLARGWSPDVQESIYRTMVCHIAATLGVEATTHDLAIDPRPRVTRIGPAVRVNTLDALRFIRGGEAA